MNTPDSTLRRRQCIRQLIIVIALVVTVLLLVEVNFALSLGFSSLCWAVYLFGTLRPNSALFGPVITSFPTTSAEVILTIDDGPDPETTPALLALLKKHNATVIFFLIGKKAQKHPELVCAIAAAGHIIGNHSMTHPSGMYWALGPTAMQREIEGCQQVLTEITGTPPLLYRSPVGHSNPFVQPLLSALGLQRMAWSARGYDAVRTDVDQIMQTMESDIRAGAIILLHEATPVAIPVMKRVLTLLKKQGLQTSVSLVTTAKN